MARGSGKAGGAPAVPAPWVLAYRPADRGAAVVAWLVIEGAPAGVKVGEVREALEGWRFWHRYAAAVAPGARLVVGRVGGAAIPTALDVADRVTWAELAPEVRRITVEVTPALHASARRAAVASGLTLTMWVERAILEAANAAAGRGAA